jgi:diguanylate cyclase (GGDEF)-like protein
MKDERVNVLIVDDVPINLRALAGALAGGARIRVATNGPRALSICRSEDPPEIVLLDVVMPGMDGHEVLRELKSDPRTMEIPVIFVTGQDDEDEELQGLELGAVDYITKPVRPAIVRARVRTQVRLERSLRMLEELASIDGLTEVPNRRQFDLALAREWARGTRTGQPLTVVLLDIDHFKAFNDNYGHQAGDVGLQRVAKALERVLKRPADLLARYGGEEFVALLPETDAIAAAALAERLRHAVEGQAIDHAHSSAAEVVTVSVGVATAVPWGNGDPEALVEAADRALYRAKEQGRNQVVQSAPSAAESVAA